MLETRVVCAWALVVRRVVAQIVSVVRDRETRTRAHAMHGEGRLLNRQVTIGHKFHIIWHCEVRAALQLGVTPALSWAIVVVVLIVVIAVIQIVHLGAGVAREVLGSTRIFFTIMTKMALDDVVDIGRTVLVQLEMVTRAFLKDNDCNVDGAKYAQFIGLFE